VAVWLSAEGKCVRMHDSGFPGWRNLTGGSSLWLRLDVCDVELRRLGQDPRVRGSGADEVDLVAVSFDSSQPSL
jgi:hypothetical protein